MALRRSIDSWPNEISTKSAHCAAIRNLTKFFSKDSTPTVDDVHQYSSNPFSIHLKNQNLLCDSSILNFCVSRTFSFHYYRKPIYHIMKHRTRFARSDDIYVEFSAKPIRCIRILLFSIHHKTEITAIRRAKRKKCRTILLLDRGRYELPYCRRLRLIH